ncbi:hypothetical protein HAT86_07375, partial [Roseovarius gahaiensis]
MKRLFPLGLASLASLAILAPGVAAAADLALVIGNHDYHVNERSKLTRVQRLILTQPMRCKAPR